MEEILSNENIEERLTNGNIEEKLRNEKVEERLSIVGKLPQLLLASGSTNCGSILDEKGWKDM